MAKKKKQKKGKVVNLLNPENYIRTKARSLPITECYISENWKDTGLANILVARRHTNHNHTYGIYLVDLLCLGVKDAMYFFNVNEEEFEDTIEEIKQHEGVKCDYDLVHSIIYGAVKFAEKYNFKPHKVFEIAKFILEEDDGLVPDTNIEFGVKGKPIYVEGPDDINQSQHIIATLERTAGPGNYEVEELGKEDFDDWDEDFEDEIFGEAFDNMDFEDDFEEEFEDDETAFGPGDLERIASGEQEATLHQTFILAAAIYRIRHKDEEFISTDTLNENLEISGDPDPNMLESEELTKLLNGFEKFTSSQKEKKLKKFLIEHGENPHVYFLLYTIRSAKDKPVEDLVKILDEKYPDYLQFQFLHACMLHTQGKEEELWRRLGGERTLSKSFPNRNNKFNVNEWLFWNAGKARYFFEKGKINLAISYILEISEYAEEDSLVEYLVKSILEVLEKETDGLEDDFDSDFNADSNE